MCKNVNQILSGVLLLLLLTAVSHALDDNFPGPNDFVPVEQMPEMIYEQTPVYPDVARKSGREATVFIKALIDKSGVVRKAMVEKSSSDNPAFGKSALTASYKNSFTPALQNQQLVAVWVTYKVDFNLADISEPSPEDFIPADIQAEMIYMEEPQYPRLAKKAGLEGTVWIKALVDQTGNVEKAQISKVSHPKAGFGQASLNAAYKCKFKPAIQNGEPIAVWVANSVDFRLDDND